MPRGKRRFQVDALVIAALLRNPDLPTMTAVFSELESRTDEYIDEAQVKVAVKRLVGGHLLRQYPITIFDQDVPAYEVTERGLKHFERFELDVRALLEGFDSLVDGKPTREREP